MPTPRRFPAVLPALLCLAGAGFLGVAALDAATPAPAATAAPAATPARPATPAPAATAARSATAARPGTVPDGAPPVLAGLVARAESTGGPGFRATFRVENRGAAPAEIVGGAFGCHVGGCLDGPGLGRVALPPGGAAEVTLTGKRWRPGAFEDAATLYVAHAGATHEVPFTVRGDLPDGEDFMPAERAAELTRRLAR